MLERTALQINEYVDREHQIASKIEVVNGINPLPKIAVAILNYNGFEHTKECLDSVRESTYKPLSIIVVDNASTDGSASKLKAVLNPDELIELPVNGGYSHGNNIGIHYAFNRGADYVFIVNNDIIIEPSCIEHLYKYISRDKRIGIIGPKVLYYTKPDTINFAGIIGLIHKAHYIRLGLNEKDRGQYEGLIDTLYQDGCALLLSRACYEKIGGFDEWLWTYSEESDLCMRAYRAGFRVCCLQQVKVWHKISATLGDCYMKKPHAVYYGTRNNYIFHRRYAGSLFKQLRAIFVLLSRTPRLIASIAINGKSSRIKNMAMLIVATWVGITTNSRRPSDILSPIKAVKREGNTN